MNKIAILAVLATLASVHAADKPNPAEAASRKRSTPLASVNGFKLIMPAESIPAEPFVCSGKVAGEGRKVMVDFFAGKENLAQITTVSGKDGFWTVKLNGIKEAKGYAIAFYDITDEGMVQWCEVDYGK